MGSDAPYRKCKTHISLQLTDRSERAGGRTRGKRGGYIRFLRRILQSDAANSNYGAGQQLVHQTCSLSSSKHDFEWSMTQEDVVKLSKCIVTLYTHMIFLVSNDSWNYATMVLPVIAFNLVLLLTRPGCFNIGEVLVINIIIKWTHSNTQSASQDNYINKVKCFVAIWNKIHSRSVTIFEKMLVII